MPAEIVDPVTQEYTGEILVPSNWRRHTIEGGERPDLEIKLVGWHCEDFWIFEWVKFEGAPPSVAHAPEKRGMKKIMDRGPMSLRALYRPVGFETTTEEAT